MPANEVASSQGAKLWQMRLIKCGSKLWLLMLRQLRRLSMITMLAEA